MNPTHPTVAAPTPATRRPNTMPPAIVVWHPTETVSISQDIIPLSVQLLREYRTLTGHVGGRGDVAHTLTIVGRVGVNEITRHDYSGEIVLECSCPVFDVGRKCEHIAAFEEAERAAALPALVDA